MSIDLMDLSGEHQNDIDHDIQKIRLDEKGKVIDIHGSSASTLWRRRRLRLASCDGLMNDCPTEQS